MREVSLPGHPRVNVGAVSTGEPQLTVSSCERAISVPPSLLTHREKPLGARAAPGFGSSPLTLITYTQRKDVQLGRASHGTKGMSALGGLGPVPFQRSHLIANSSCPHRCVQPFDIDLMLSSTKFSLENCVIRLGKKMRKTFMTF